MDSIDSIDFIDSIDCIDFIQSVRVKLQNCSGFSGVGYLTDPVYPGLFYNHLCS